MEIVQTGRGHGMKGRMQRMLRVNDPAWPDCPIGIADMAEILGVTTGTVLKHMRMGDSVCGLPVTDMGKMRVAVGRECIRCGAVVGNLQDSVYCDQCRVENRAKGQARRAAETEPADHKNRHEVPYEQKSSLSRVAWDARQAGMSYGQYMTARTARWFT